MIAIVEKMIHREGFGQVLTDGVKAAASQIGRGAQEFAIEIGGQEPGLPNASFLPGRGTGLMVDATPGRGTAAAPFTRIDVNAAAAPYQEFDFSDFERWEYGSKGLAGAVAGNYWQVATSAGLCLFPVILSEVFPLLGFINAITGWDISMAEALQTGARIQTLRQMFNIREESTPRRFACHSG